MFLTLWKCFGRTCSSAQSAARSNCCTDRRNSITTFGSPSETAATPCQVLRLDCEVWSWSLLMTWNCADFAHWEIWDVIWSDCVNMLKTRKLSIAFWNSVTLFCFCFLLLCHCVTRSCQVNHVLIGLQIIRFYAYYSKRNDVSSQSTLSVLIVNRNNEQLLLMYFRFGCSRDISRCNKLLYGTGPFWKYSRSFSKELDLLLILNNNQTFSSNITLEEHVRLFSRLSPMLYLEQTNLSNIFFTTKHLIWRPPRPTK